MSSTSANTSVARAALAFAALPPLEQLAYIRDQVGRLESLAEGITERLDAALAAEYEALELRRKANIDHMHDLVWESYGNGHAWLRPDLTAKNRGPL